MTERTALIMGHEYTQDGFLDFIAGKGHTEMTRPHETYDITLAGRNYQFRQPKTAILIAGLMQSKGKSQLEASQIMAEMQLKWLKAGVGKDAWAEIEARMFDPEDELDWGDIDEVFKTHTTKERPTTSPSDSSDRSLTTTPSEEKPKLPESTFGL